MQIITSGLPANFRLYLCGDVHVRVGVSVIDDGVYRLVAEATDAAGGPIGPASAPFVLTHTIDQIDPPVLQATKGTANKGELATEGGLLFEGDGAAWIDRGPVPDGATAAACEIISIWDRAGQALAERTCRAWSRQSATTEINNLLGV